MVFLGTIEPDSNLATGKPEWMRLIDTHPQLSRAPAVEGINPFTRGPHLFKADPYAARVRVESRQVGSIHWAMDDSRRLVVWADPGSEENVRNVAEEVASKLGWRFVANMEPHPGAS